MSIISSRDPVLRRFRQTFPILRKNVSYFDSAATTLKPLPVLNAMNAYYREYGANVHRGNYQWARDATNAYEQARAQVAHYLSCPARELVVTSGATEAINIVARGVEHLIKEGDNIVITEQEHHANFVPWVWLAQRAGANLVVVPVTPDGQIDAAAMLDAINNKPALLAVTAMSNVVGDRNPVEQWCAAARGHGAICLIDGAQHLLSLGNQSVVGMGAQFYVFSGHKAYGDTGVGVLWGEYQWLDKLKPSTGGGEMISHVSAQCIELKPVPARLEAGTPPIAQLISLGAALSWWAQQDRSALMNHKLALASRLCQSLQSGEQFTLLGNVEHNQGIVTLVPTQSTAQDWAYWLDAHNVAVRVGQHCAQPLADAVGCTSLLRVSLAPFNTQEEVDGLIALLTQPIANADVSAQPITWACLQGHSAQQQLVMIIGSAHAQPTWPAQPADQIEGCESDTYIAVIDGNWVGWSRSNVIDGLIQLILCEANTGVSVADINLKIDEIGIGRWLSRSRRSGIDAVLERLTTASY